MTRHRGTDIELRANPQYFRGRPHIDILRIEIVPNLQTAATIMRSNAADLALLGSPQVFNSMRGLRRIKLYDPLVPSFEAIEINNAKPALRDSRVRKAIAMAIDRNRIEGTVEHGESLLATGPISLGSWAYSKNVALYEYNPTAARDLLRVAGKKSLDLTFAYGAGSPSAQNLAIQVQGMLRAVGIDVTLKAYAFELLYAPYSADGVFATGNYDLGLFDTTTGPDPDDAISMFECKQIPPLGDNFSRYCSQSLDVDARRAVEALRQPSRARLYADAQKIMSKDEPVVFLFWLKQLYECSSRFQGFAPNPFTESWNAADWKLKGTST